MDNSGNDRIPVKKMEGEKEGRKWETASTVRTPGSLARSLSQTALGWHSSQHWRGQQNTGSASQGQLQLGSFSNTGHTQCSSLTVCTAPVSTCFCSWANIYSQRRKERDRTFTCAPPPAALGVLGAEAEGTPSPLALPRPLPCARSWGHAVTGLRRLCPRGRRLMCSGLCAGSLGFRDGSLPSPVRRHSGNSF